jgi:hypothetical protein
VLLPETCLSCTHYGLSAICYLKLGEDVRDVITHGLVAEHESSRDRLIAVALGDQPQHLAFAIGELGKCQGPISYSRCREVLDDPLGDRRPEDRISGSDRLDRPQSRTAPLAVRGLRAKLLAPPGTFARS